METLAELTERIVIVRHEIRKCIRYISTRNNLLRLARLIGQLLHGQETPMAGT